MAPRWLIPAIVVVLTGCGDKDKPGAGKGAAEPTSADLDRECEQLAMICGDKDKHIDKIVDACKTAAKPQVEKGCVAKTIAAYGCYQKELCSGKDKIWALDDLRVLAERHEKCVAERDAAQDCVAKK